MKIYPFPKVFRLVKSSDFNRVYKEGKIIRSKEFVLFYSIGEEEKPARLGITVTRQFGKAARRNRIKRQIREAFRHLHSRLKPGVDVVVNVHRLADNLSQKDVLDRFSSLLSKAGVKSVALD
jgi:ribonuclease P protein component